MAGEMDRVEVMLMLMEEMRWSRRVLVVLAAKSRERALIGPMAIALAEG